MVEHFAEMDGLVLSVIYKHNQLDLVQWLGIIDFYERIIISFDELRGALSRLQKSGLITYSDGAFCLASDATNLFSKSFDIRNYERISKTLSSKEIVNIAEEKFVLTEADYSTALQEYRNRWKNKKV